MEALSNAPTNLITNKVFMWAASNLPDEGGLGSFTTNERGSYDHDTNSFWKAIGMPEDTPERVHIKVSKAAHEFVDAQQDKICRSMVFEAIEKECGYEGLMYLATVGFNKLHDAWTGDDADSAAEAFKDFIRKLKG
ncbi:MAG: hypothetical protein EBU90_16060 [Proteobacteria bacterium]|nr:hypothetical protein [Pseudomonadota bacterium]NBP15229.1 hypothetical protein [bacterium]